MFPTERFPKILRSSRSERSRTIVLLFLSLLSCGGSGKIVTDVREIEPFTGIEIRGPVRLEVIVAPDQPQTFAVSGDSNIVAQLDSAVTDGTLAVSYPRGYRLADPAQVVAYVADLARLAVAFRGDSEVVLKGEPLDDLRVEVGVRSTLRLRGVDAGRLDVRVDATGKLQAEGRARELLLEAKGVSTADLSGLCAARVVEATGSGRVDGPDTCPD